ncbi:hypothetical protein A2U01_0110070, partial [Trifolium medium]|nr:hypothetical protein [Trifolium medium]
GGTEDDEEGGVGEIGTLSGMSISE